MKNTVKKILSVVLAVMVVTGLALTGYADETPFADDAYATVVTASDFQNYSNAAYKRFEKVLGLAKNDGLPAPDSLLVGGDYTMVLADDAAPGISKIRGAFLNAYPDADPASVICIQGNHDNPIKELTETGFYNMGAYCLYAVCEDDFPWKQNSKKPDGVQALAADIDSKINAMTEAGDMRPVIVITHVPLHHTGRNSYGDNMYASYIFNVLNKQAETRDIIFIYGHNHSGTFDDYIGGAVNFLAPGDTIRIPFADKKGADCYTDETLNFTYTNCGYIGYSDNSVNDISTDTLTMGVIQFTPDVIRFIRYSEDGLYMTNDVDRVNGCTDTAEPEYPDMDDTCMCHSNIPIVRTFWKFILFFSKLFGTNKYCICGEAHY